MVVAILAVVATIGLPALVRARVAANETSAIGSLRSIHSAQGAYLQNLCAGGFAQTLSDLALPPTGSNHGFIPATLASNGIFKVTLSSCLAPGEVGYVIAVNSREGGESSSYLRSNGR